MARIQILDPYSILLSKSSEIYREPVGLKYTDYQLQQYDSYTLIYDIFYVMEDNIFIAIGPPLLNLTDLVLPLTIKINYNSIQVNIKQQKDITYYYIGASHNEYALNNVFHFNFNGYIVEKIVKLNRIKEYNANLTLSTLQKNNPISWIIDWCKYHVHAHKVDAIVIYDNASEYSQELPQQLADINCTNIIVVHWPYPYGISHEYHTMYSQVGSLNHMRLCFGYTTKWIINLDIDEYLWTNQNIPIYNTIYNRLEKYLVEGYSAVYFKQKIMTGISHEPISDNSIRNYIFSICPRSNKGKWYGRVYKYIYNPKLTLFCGVHRIGLYRRNQDASVTIISMIKHSIKYIFMHKLPSSIILLHKLYKYMNINSDGYCHVFNYEDVCFYHYWGLNTKWCYKDIRNHKTYQSNELICDRNIIDAYQKTIPRKPV